MTERESIMRVHVIAADIDTLRSSLAEFRALVAGGVQPSRDGRVGIDAYLNLSQLERVRGRSVEVRVVEDATATGAARQAEVEEGNPYEDGSLPDWLDEPSGGA
jgi:hypothetical protein